jgi:hypothetical protein
MAGELGGGVFEHDAAELGHLGVVGQLQVVP